jgi:lipid-binding SYLF domain-containing protein
VLKSLCIVVALMALGIAGCSKQRQAAGPPTNAPTTAAPPVSARVDGGRDQGASALREATAVIEKLTKTSSDGFPDAVLSRAKCLIVLPQVYKKRRDPRLATAACRIGNNWTNPSFVDAIGIAVPAIASNAGKKSSTRADADLLIFVMSDRGEEALLSGSINLSSDIAVNAGPQEKPGTIVADVELKGSDALAYLHTSGKLYGVPLSTGRLQLDAEMSKQVFGRSAEPKTMLAEAGARSPGTERFNVMVDSLFYVIRPAGIIIHHSVLVPEPATAQQDLDRFHANRGFSITCFGRVYHVAYHYLILPDGTVQAGRPERCQGAHTRGYNSYLGIALVGDFSSQDNPHGKKGQMVPSEAQMHSLLEVTRRLRQRYDIPIHRIVRHSDISRTYCPGDRFLFTRFLGELQRSTSRGF